MSKPEFDPAPTNYSLGQGRSWEKEIILVSPGVSQWAFVPELINGVQCTIIPSGGATGAVETTTDLIDSIRNRLETADEWPWGVVNSKQSHSVRPPSAIRLKMVGAGTSLKLTMRGQ